MKKKKIYSYSFLVILLSVSGLMISSKYHPNQTESIPQSEKDTKASASDENFDKMMRVLTHQRCVNCHPNDNIPKQGEDSHPHYFGLARGENNHGFESLKCNTCHQKENNDFSGVPGAPEWSLAPESMKWEGLTRVEIAESILDTTRNGGRSHEDVMHHLTEHELVLWAWNPGVDANGKPREKPPVPKDEYIEAVKAWFAAGAKIPVK